jgi:hypothetical protein
MAIALAIRLLEHVQRHVTKALAHLRQRDQYQSGEAQAARLSELDAARKRIAQWDELFADLHADHERAKRPTTNTTAVA